MLKNAQYAIVYGIVIPMLVIVCTIAFGFCFAPEKPSSLFFFNMFYLVFLEMIFFGVLDFRRMVKNSERKSYYLAKNMMSLYYVFTGIMIMAVYLFLMNRLHGMFYITFQIAILILWILWLVSQNRSGIRLLSVKDADSSEHIAEFLEKLEMLSARYVLLSSIQGWGSAGDVGNPFLFLIERSAKLPEKSVGSTQLRLILNEILYQGDQLLAEHEKGAQQKYPEVESKYIQYKTISLAKIDLIKFLDMRVPSVAYVYESRRSS